MTKSHGSNTHDTRLLWPSHMDVIWLSCTSHSDTFPNVLFSNIQPVYLTSTESPLATAWKIARYLPMIQTNFKDETRVAYCSFPNKEVLFDQRQRGAGCTRLAHCNLGYIKDQSSKFIITWCTLMYKCSFSKPALQVLMPPLRCWNGRTTPVSDHHKN